jgi:hypothetical protein
MKKTLLTLVIALAVLSADAQIEKLAGPRVGVTMITSGSLASLVRGDAPFFPDGDQASITDEWTGSTGKYGAAISQYGWQWESRFADGGGDVTGMVEWVALVGGMEQGKFLPSVSSIIGARTSGGFEIGVRPNLSFSGVGMLFAIGHNFKSGNLNLPVNLVFMPGRKKDGERDNPSGSVESYEYNTGSRISIMIGFNMSK